MCCMLLWYSVYRTCVFCWYTHKCMARRACVQWHALDSCVSSITHWQTPVCIQYMNMYTGGTDITHTHTHTHIHTHIILYAAAYCIIHTGRILYFWYLLYTHTLECIIHILSVYIDHVEWISNFRHLLCVYLTLDKIISGCPLLGSTSLSLCHLVCRVTIWA